MSSNRSYSVRLEPVFGQQRLEHVVAIATDTDGEKQAWHMTVFDVARLLACRLSTPELLRVEASLHEYHPVVLPQLYERGDIETMKCVSPDNTLSLSVH